LAVRQTVAPPPLPQFCASAKVPALTPKASRSAGIKVLMFTFKFESARPVVSSGHERYEERG
jgi:hypothetical protein